MIGPALNLNWIAGRQNTLAATKRNAQSRTIYEEHKCANAAVSDDHEHDRRFECSGANS
jgi:hypothetical protein